MERGLQQIANLPYVGGSFVCDNAGEVIVSSNPAPLATVTMNAIGREAAQAFAACEAAGRAAARLDLTYDTWRLLATDVGDAILFAVCDPQVDMPVLRMTVDIVTAGWKKDSSAQKLLAKRRSSRKATVEPAQMDDISRRLWQAIQSQV
jgi:hypothetical protein